MPHSKTVFDRILNSTKSSRLAVFDLDSTLFNVSVRTQKIVSDFIEDLEMQRAFPREVEFLKKIKVLPTEWGLRETLSREGLKSTDSFYFAIRDFWKKHFFSSPYLQFDIPYPGAIEYVKSLHANGVDIFYLTGRDEENMLSGTIEGLLKHGFPLASPEKQLHMKRLKGEMEDEDFKAAKFESIIKLADEVWFFENEPLIIKKVAAKFPELNIVWIDTTHSRRENPPEGYHIIRDVWHK